MYKMVYTNSYGETIDLHSDYMSLQTALPMRGYEWEYAIGYNNVDTVRREPKKATCDCIFLNYDRVDKLRHITDSDVLGKTPGTFSLINTSDTSDVWYQKGYIVAFSPQSMTTKNLVAKLEILLLEGVWRKEIIKHFMPRSATRKGAIDYKHDYPHDLGQGIPSSLVEVDGWCESEFRLDIFGACTRPHITIGKNIYRVDTNVQAGEVLTINSQDKTIQLLDTSGYTQNLFSKGYRGAGKGEGEYIFETLKPGVNVVSWENTFGFDLTYYIEESGLPWQTS